MKIATYNISHCQDFSAVTSDDAPVNIEKLAEYLKTIDADIVTLNEVFIQSVEPVYDRQTQKINAVAKYPYCAEGVGAALQWASLGNVIFSKYPIEKSESICVPAPNKDERRENETEWYEDRVIVSAVLNVDGKRVRVMTTHVGLNPLEKERMISALCSAVDATDMPIILMGDFNAYPHTDVLAPVYRRLKSCADEMGNNDFTFASFEPDRTIDYIFVSNGIKINDFTVRHEIISDHRACVADIEL